MKEVIQGAQGVFDISLAEKDSAGILRPFDLTGHTATTPQVCWRAGTTKIEKLLTDPDVTIQGLETAGQIRAILDASETLTFPNGEIGDIEVVVDDGLGGIKKFQILESWRVIEKICD